MTPTPMQKVTAWMVNPFGYLETRWTWPGRFGYLVAVIAEKTSLKGHHICICHPSSQVPRPHLL